MVVPIFSAIAFEWDDGNRHKNKIKHDVTIEECEQIFFNQPLLLLDDEGHSNAESRWYALGRTVSDRHLSIVFTIRKERIRVISARDMSKREQTIYAKA